MPLGAFALLVSGFKNYVSVQRWMVVFTAIAITTTIVVLFVVDPKTVPDKLNAFSVAVGGTPNYYQGAIDAVTAKGIDMNPPFSLLATLLVAPIAWTSLQWATYSAEQNGEIKDAKSFKTQAFIFIGGLRHHRRSCWPCWAGHSRDRSERNSCTWPAPATGAE